MRKYLVLPVLVLVLVAAGCGGGGGGGGSTSGGGGGGQSGEAAKPAATVLADAVKAANAASSVHMSGTVNTSGKPITLDLTVVKGKGATGSITLKGAKVDLVVVGGNGYMRGGSEFWKQFAGATGGAIAQLLSGKWLKFPASNPQFGSLTEFTNTKSLFNQLSSGHGALTNKGATTYKGQSVVAIDGGAKNGTLYVAASGTPYPVALVKTTGGSTGAITFDSWNKPVSLTAPSKALDFSQLSSSG